MQYIDPCFNSVRTDFLFIANMLENHDSANSETLFEVLIDKLKILNLDV